MSKYRNEQNFLVKQASNLPLNQKIYIKNIYPCYLGILFIGKISPSIFKKLKFQIELVFDSFFFDITFIGKTKLDTSLHNLHTKEEFNLLDRTLSKVILFSTSTFYSMIKPHMSENNLGIGLGLTDRPIFSSSDEKLLFLFGEANIKNKYAVVSTHNLLDFNNSEIAENRIVKEIIHEIGHLILGLEHCLNDKCVMRFSKNIEEIDRKSKHLCLKCNSELENLRILNNF